VKHAVMIKYYKNSSSNAQTCHHNNISCSSSSVAYKKLQYVERCCYGDMLLRYAVEMTF